MGERIGDYIHFHYKNYLEHGTTFKDDKDFTSVTSIAQQHEEMIRKFVKQRTIANKQNIKETLEQQLNFFFGASGSIDGLGYTEKQWQEIQETIIKTFEATMSRDFPNLDLGRIDYNTLSAFVTAQQLQPIVASTSQSLGRKGTYTWTNAVDDRIKQLKKAVEQALDPKDSFVLDEEAIKRIEAIDEQFVKIKKEIEEKAPQTDKIVSRRKMDLSGNVENQKFIAELNSLIGRVKSDRLSQVQGYLGEYIPAITQYILKQYANKEIDKVIEEDVIKAFNAQGIVVGKDSSSRELISKNFVQTTSESAIFSINDINNKVNKSFKQDKVDIILEGPLQEKIPISAKNVNLASGREIGLLKGSSLIKMLQDYPGFANHYANVTAVHVGSHPNAYDLEAMHHAMKVTIGAYALAGGMYGRNKQTGILGHSQKAEFLLINDNSTGKFKVYSIEDLINNLITDIDKLKIHGYKDPKWQNVWVGEHSVSNARAAYRRAISIIVQMHKLQYEVSLDPEILS